jgi:magnesium chelatase subunit D
LDGSQLRNSLYPFSAIVGQDAMKLGLILNAINPGVGGFLIRGEKGTAKSTAVRALSHLLPEIDVAADCPYSCDPANPEQQCRACRENGSAVHRRPVRLVELPLNATEDMVIGGLDFSASLRQGAPVFRPGLLAQAHRGILYIDEVNLLSDHLVDAILDVAASGRNVVQREGIAHRHPARFILVGTMNPEEGELRPQFLDRFGLSIEVQGARDTADRMEVLSRRDAFDRLPHDFREAFAREERALAAKIAAARRLIPNVSLERNLDRAIADLCAQHLVAGHRADIVIAHAARALAAFEGRSEATEEDVRRIAPLALDHRARKPPPKREAPSAVQGLPRPPKRVRRHGYPDDYDEQEPAHSSIKETQGERTDFGLSPHAGVRMDRPEAIFDIGAAFKVRPIAQQRDRLYRHEDGKRSRTRTKRKRGRYVRSTTQRRNDDIAVDATLRAAAPHQVRREAENGLTVAIREEDIREKIRESRTGNFLLFIVDASGSMGAKGRMVASKGAIMSLLKDAYQKRDRVAMVSFRKHEAVVNLPPTSSIFRAQHLLKELPIGGKTPLAAGLRKAAGVLRNVLIKDPACKPIVIVITDGKANESFGNGDPFWEALSAARTISSDKRVKSIVVDAEEDGDFRYGFSARLAEVLKGECVRIRDLRADLLLEIAKSRGGR